MRLVEDTKRKISVVTQSKSVFASKGSIMISLQGSIRRIAVTQYDAYLTEQLQFSKIFQMIFCQSILCTKLQKIFSLKEKTARGSTIKTIAKKEFTNFQIPIPPLKEQVHIISILDRFDALCNDLTRDLPRLKHGKNNANTIRTSC